ncbi:MAG TPA: VTT domain-containing protein [Gemmatales bacterium]|nr:VTT domain-containing protein [Gemmatales bacterium]
MSFLRRILGCLQDQVILLILLCLVGVFIPWNEVLNHSRDVLHWMRTEVTQRPLMIACVYVAGFVALTAISVPGPTSLLLAVLGGWLFGWWGLPLSSFSSSVGASLAFLSSRYLLRDSTLFRFFPKLQRFNEDRSQTGWLVLLSCRLNPLIPYFLENLYFGRTQMPLWQFWLVTLIGMLPLTTLYIMTGAELAKLETYQGLISWEVVAWLVAASLGPLVLYLFVTKRTDQSK